MAEDPTKLFSNRAERYPQPDDTDKARAVIEKIAEQVPVLGPATVHILSQFLMPAYQRRQEEWFKEFADGVDELAAKVDSFKIENLHHDEAFVSAVIEVSRSAISTHMQEKRDALRNALLNIALHRSPDEDQQQTFLRYIDELTVWHLRVLSLFQNPTAHLTAKRKSADYMMGGAAQVIEDAYPELSGKCDFYDQVVADLYARGFLDSTPSFLHTTMTGGGMVAKRTSAIADAFLEFIADPLP